MNIGNMHLHRWLACGILVQPTGVMLIWALGYFVIYKKQINLIGISALGAVSILNVALTVAANYWPSDAFAGAAIVLAGTLLYSVYSRLLLLTTNMWDRRSRYFRLTTAMRRCLFNLSFCEFASVEFIFVNRHFNYLTAALWVINVSCVAGIFVIYMRVKRLGKSTA
jgi:hypothetical protein